MSSKYHPPRQPTGTRKAATDRRIAAWTQGADPPQAPDAAASVAELVGAEVWALALAEVARQQARS